MCSDKIKARVVLQFLPSKHKSIIHCRLLQKYLYLVLAKKTCNVYFSAFYVSFQEHDILVILFCLLFRTFTRQRSVIEKEYAQVSVVKLRLRKAFRKGWIDLHTLISPFEIITYCSVKQCLLFRSPKQWIRTHTELSSCLIICTCIWKM